MRVMGVLSIRGADVSFVDEIEQAGGTFRDVDGGKPEDVLAILRRSGVNAARLRLWNDPPGGFCNLERTVAMGRRIKTRGFRFLLDFHYSDGWADPAKQYKPKAWERLSFGKLCEAVYWYTFDVLRELSRNGAAPDEVQVGNEITPGFLWDDGRVDGAFDTDEQWRKFAELLGAGIRAVRDALPSAQVMVHIDRGGDREGACRFFERLGRFDVEYDVIGLSYYPWWHGTLNDLRATLEALAAGFGKPLVVVETAYPWTLEAPPEHPLIVAEPSQLHAGYPASVEGQRRFLLDLAAVVADTPRGLGTGFYYWEPCWIPVKREWSVGHANNWTNLTLFDFSGRKLDSWAAFRDG